MLLLYDLVERAIPTDLWIEGGVIIINEVKGLQKMWLNRELNRVLALRQLWEVTKYNLCSGFVCQNNLVECGPLQNTGRPRTSPVAGNMDENHTLGYCMLRLSPSLHCNPYVPDRRDGNNFCVMRMIFWTALAVSHYLSSSAGNEWQRFPFEWLRWDVFFPREILEDTVDKGLGNPICFEKWEMFLF